MAKQSLELLDMESGYIYTLETLNDAIQDSFKVILPEKNGTMALLGDITALEDKLKAGDVVVKNSTRLDDKTIDYFAKSDLSNVTSLTEELQNLLRGPIGYTGSRGATGYTGSAGTNGTISTATPTGGVDGDTWFQY